MSCKKSNWFFVVAFMISILPSAFAQKETGAISGHVTDADGAAIPAVKIVASNITLTGYNSETYTGQDGSYRFTALHPGEYEVKAELYGFQKVVRKGVRLFVGQTVIVDFTLEPLPISEVLEIQGRTPAFDATSPSSSKTVPAEEVQSLPKFSSSVDLFTLTPGVGDLDHVAYGSTPFGNAFWFDGVDVSNPLSGLDFWPPNYNWIEEVQVVGIGAPAEYSGFTGVIANSVSKSGSNQFHGLLETFFQNDSFTGNNVDDSTLSAAEKNLFTDTTVQLGGPIVLDKFWFFTGFQYYYTKEVPFGYPPNGEEAFLTREQPKIINKLTYKANQNNTFQGFIERDDTNISGRGADAFHLPEATGQMDRPQWFWNASWISFLRSQTFLDLRAGGFSTDLKVSGINGSLPGHLDAATGIWSQNYYGREHTSWNRNQVNASLSHYAQDFIQGSHDFKFGVQYERSHADREVHYSGDIFYYDYQGAPYYRYMNEGYHSEPITNTVGIFAQDNWHVTDRIDMSLGVRWDHNRMELLTASTEYSTDGVAPRLGIVYALNSDRTAILKAHYGHYYDHRGSGLIIGIGDRSEATVEAWNQDIGQWEVVGFIPGANFWTIDDDLKQPYTQQFTAGMDRVLPGGVNISAHYIYKKDRDLIEDVDAIGVYEPVPYVNPLTGETITVYNRLNPEDGTSFFITNPSSLFRRYHGFEIYGNKRFSNKFYVGGSIVFSQIRGNVDNDLDEGFGVSGVLDSPNDQINSAGRLENDVSTEIKLHGYYYFPWGINTGWYFRHFSGDTWTPVVRVAGLNQGPFFIYGLPRGSNRLPDRNVLDIRLEKMFSIYTGQLRFTLDVFNIFNTGYPLAIEANVQRGSYGAPSQFSLPRELRLGIRYTF